VLRRYTHGKEVQIVYLGLILFRKNGGRRNEYFENNAE
jgi:hypothetical protein